MLYPQNNEKRLAIRLDGIWQFRKDPDNVGVTERWQDDVPPDTIPMAVPAAFNELTQDPALRDYYGVVWYFTTITSLATAAERQVLRFGAVHCHADVFLNGEKIAENHVGKLPFEIDVHDRFKSGLNMLAVRVDTALNWQTLPPGTYKDAPHIPEYHFDFLNFGGILRSVWLYGTAATYIRDIAVTQAADGDTPIGIDFIITSSADADVQVTLLDAFGDTVAQASGVQGALRPSEPTPWSPESPYLYTLVVRLGRVDMYRLPVGLRTVRLTDEKLLINGTPTYLKGFGMHEDFHLHGHGHSDVRLVKDFQMLKTMGANSFRTSHYPYAEEVYQLADQMGFLVIDEAPAVGMNSWGAYPVFTEQRVNDATLENHLAILEQMYTRDKNHACIVMWSVANEPSCDEANAEPYFKALAGKMRALDSSRPVTMVLSSFPPTDDYESGHSQAAQYFDVICYNRYYSWYADAGRLEVIRPQLGHEIRAWRNAFPDKPILLAEFGADTLAGMHADPPVMFSEEYQQQLLAEYTDELDTYSYILGEHVWNFADFVTKQGITRVMGNRKGVHTRDRQPKAAAHFLRRRWLSH